MFGADSKAGLYTVESMKAICALEDRLVTPFISSRLQEKCRMMSLPFYIAYMSGKNSCSNITQDDMLKFKARMIKCWPLYADGTLKNPGNYQKGIASGNFSECYDKAAMFHVFFFLTDIGFINNSTHGVGKLSYTTMHFFDQQISGNEALEYFKTSIDKMDLSAGDVKVIGFHYNDGVKFDLFSSYFIGDIWLFALAMGLILVIMLVYLYSFTLMFMTVLNVAFSFITAFCLYHLVFQISFFPFINLLGGLILIAIGADDVFIFYDTWQQVKAKDSSMPLGSLITQTFNHAALSIFVTSLTTSAAFLANFVSNITAIKCFGLFAGIAVLANFFFMVTWTPSVVTAMEKYRKWGWNSALIVAFAGIFMTPLMVIFRLFDMGIELLCSMSGVRRHLSRGADKIFGKFFPAVIDKAWPVWLLLFSGIGIGGMIAVFYSPKLKLPSSKDFQLFPDSQPMEKFDQKLKTHFRYVLEAEEKAAQDMEIGFVWGVKPKDNGDLFDPRAKVTLVHDNSFNMTSNLAQKWMEDFCKDLVKQSFVSPHYPADMCMYPTYEKEIKASCGNHTGILRDKVDRVCCNIDSFPTNASNYEKCLPSLMYLSVQTLGRPLVDQKTNLPSAYLLRIVSNQRFETSFEKMDDFKSAIDGFLSKWLAKAPPGLRNGWAGIFYEELNFYDLQKAIANGTYYSILLSLSVAFLVMLFTSLNVLITIYALITITLAIAATIACLVFMGWELNIVESVTISLAVGLSIDFTIHYGVAYRLSKEKLPRLRVRESFQRVGSAVVMAALTTFLAGSAIMPSRIIAYRKLGIFLMLVMTFSWLYATFFFQSLCKLAGPKGKFCQIPLPWRSRRRVRYETELEPQSNMGATLMLRSDSEDSNLVTF